MSRNGQVGRHQAAGMLMLTCKRYAPARERTARPARKSIESEASAGSANTATSREEDKGAFVDDFGFLRIWTLSSLWHQQPDLQTRGERRQTCAGDHDALSHAPPHRNHLQLLLPFGNLRQASVAIGRRRKWGGGVKTKRKRSRPRQEQTHRFAPATSHPPGPARHPPRPRPPTARDPRSTRQLPEKVIRERQRVCDKVQEKEIRQKILPTTK